MSLAPPLATLQQIFRMKYGDPASCGWGPRMRWRYGYFNPDDCYEALLSGLIGAETRWLDVGCGRELFPSNRPLAEQLSQRCARLVGVDPDATLDENPYVHERVRAPFEQYDGRGAFDLITLRMVAEHVAEPLAVMSAIRKAARYGARVVIYTINRWSPVPIMTACVPFALRHPIKRVLWRTEKKDTFPTAYKMNTRARLRGLFEGIGAHEEWFTKLDDCRSFGRFKVGLWSELALWRALRAVGLRYPETCLLGVYTLEQSHLQRT